MRATCVWGVLFVTAAAAWAAPHPFHDDGGAVNWKTNFAAALQASRQTGKPIFLEAGREA